LIVLQFTVIFSFKFQLCSHKFIIYKTVSNSQLIPNKKALVTKGGKSGDAWNKTPELIWRVYDPEISNSFLQEIILPNSSPRQFDYRIDPDDNWELAK